MEDSDLSTTQTDILDVLGEGRANPKLLLKRVDGLESQQQANYHLRQLRALDKIECVSMGLYQIADGGERQ